MIKFIGHDRLKYLSGKDMGKSKIAERQRERGRALQKMSDGVGNKICHWRKYL